MEKLDKLYQGKAKKLYATENPDVLWVEYMNQATAGNGAKKEDIDGKGVLNNRITALMFDLLKARGINSHFIRRISDDEQLVQRMDMFPLEIIMRNVAAGSFAKRYGVREGTRLKRPVLEFCLKSDELGDPFINDDSMIALGLVDEDELGRISLQARAVNEALLDVFGKIGVRLVDFKIEEGRNSAGEILLADEITPDTCRLWDERNSRTGGDVGQRIEHLDKDIFRRDLGSIIPAYEEIYRRLAELADSENISLRQ